MRCTSSGDGLAASVAAASAAIDEKLHTTLSERVARVVVYTAVLSPLLSWRRALRSSPSGASGWTDGLPD